MTNMTARESNTKISRIIGNLKNNLANYRKYVGEAALAIMTHAKAFEDCDKARELVLAMSPRDQPQFIGWLASVSCIRVAKDVKSGGFKASLVKGDRTFDFAKAGASNWWEFGKTPATPDPKAVLALFDSVITSLKMNDIKLAKYKEDERDEVKDYANKLTQLVSGLRATVAADQTKNTAKAAANLMGLTNLTAVISRAS